MVGEISSAAFAILSVSSIFFIILPGIFYLLPFAAFFLFFSQPQLSRAPAPEPAKVEVVERESSSVFDGARAWGLDSQSAPPAHEVPRAQRTARLGGNDEKFRGNDEENEEDISSWKWSDDPPVPAGAVLQALSALSVSSVFIFSPIYARPPTQFASSYISRAPPARWTR